MKILSRARHLDGRYAFNGSNKAKIECRLQAMAANWSVLLGFCLIVSASVTGMDSCAASLGEVNRLNKNVCGYLRALSKGKVYDRGVSESHGCSCANAQLLYKWKVLTARAELAIKRVKWWQAMTEHSHHAHLQTMAAIWGHLPDEEPTLTPERFLAPTANPFAVVFSTDLHLFKGLSGTEEFFELREEGQFPVVAVFDKEEVRDAFQRTDVKLIRSAAFSNQVLWDTLNERTLPRFDREGADNCVCEVT